LRSDPAYADLTCRPVRRRPQPFFMAPINARVVRRSLALRGLEQRVAYSECSSVGLWLRMLWVHASSRILALALN
jgi:hypothetical protein